LTYIVVKPGRRGPSTAFECPFLFAKRRGRRSICEVDDSCGRVVHDAVVDLGVLGIINSRGCVHRRELVE
jgi:hypothetical protein